MNKDNSLVSQGLFHDPRVEQAKKLLLKVLNDHQSKLTSVRLPNPNLKKVTKNRLNPFRSSVEESYGTHILEAALDIDALSN